jgi:hypothetical protein
MTRRWDVGWSSVVLLALGLGCGGSVGVEGAGGAGGGPERTANGGAPGQGGRAAAGAGGRSSFGGRGGVGGAAGAGIGGVGAGGGAAGQRGTAGAAGAGNGGAGAGGGTAGQPGGAGGVAGQSGSGGAVAANSGEATSWAIDAAHDNDQPSDTVASPLTKAWSAAFQGDLSYPLIAGGNVFVSTDESQPNVRALSLGTGAVVWGPIAIGSTVQLAYDQGRLYTLDDHGNIGALDATSGHRLWSNQVTSQYSFGPAPVAAGGLVWVEASGEGGTLTAFNGATGKIAWAADTFDGSDGTVAVGGGVVWESEACDQVSAFTEATGALEWYYSTSCTGGGGTTPAYYNGWVWVRDNFLGNIILDSSGNPQGSFAVDVPPSFDGGTAFYVRTNTVTAVDVASSTIRWSFSGDGKLCTMAAIAGAGKQVFMGSSTGNVYEIDETSGTQRSMDSAGAAVTCGSERSSLAIGGGHLVVPAGSSLVVY